MRHHRATDWITYQGMSISKPRASVVQLNALHELPDEMIVVKKKRGSDKYSPLLVALGQRLWEVEDALYRTSEACKPARTGFASTNRRQFIHQLHENI
jgi:hypothetical protein